MQRFIGLFLVHMAATHFVFAADALAEDESRAVLITGASTGIGRMAAERLAEAGYFVYAGARKKSDMDVNSTEVMHRD